jgi:poly(3-hydroxybutyrate) depolymerase
VTQALLRITKGGPALRPSTWADLARRVAPLDQHGPWPRLPIWHGDADTTVAPGNAIQPATQWRALHGLPDVPSRDEIEAGARHRAWGDAVELWILQGMAHGYPIGDGIGQPGSFVFDIGLPATGHIAAFWQLDCSSAAAVPWSAVALAS